jgi:hypothetical protein
MKIDRIIGLKVEMLGNVWSPNAAAAMPEVNSRPGTSDSAVAVVPPAGAPDVAAAESWG